ncbi:MAG: hypothetical protein ACO3XJ_00980 [Candidatus Nanopelagicales bacterium]
MDILYKVLVVLHFVGLASLLGGFLVQLSAPAKVINRSIMDGMWTMLATGLLLAGIASSQFSEDLGANFHTKIGVKLLILIVIAILVLQNRKQTTLQKGTYFAIGLLALTNVVIAVMV